MLVESVSFRASEAYLVVPVPFGTADVGRSVEVGGVEDAGSVLDDEAFVTFDTDIVVEGSAVVIKLFASALEVESISG